MIKQKKLYLSIKMDLKETNLSEQSDMPFGTLELMNILRSSATILSDDVDTDSILKFNQWLASDLDEIISASRRIQAQRDAALNSKNASFDTSEDIAKAKEIS
jgi:hypothetical protein